MDATDARLTLVRLAQAGDRLAFEELVNLHRPRLERMAGARLRRRGMKNVDLEDILQEALLRGYRRIGSFRWEGDGSFLRWLRGVVENVILETARRGARKPFFQIERDVPDEGPSPSRILRREERFERLEGALQALRPEHREVIILSRLEGLTFAEIAGRMRRSPQAVKQLLWRALKKLKASFGDTESLRLPWRSLPEEGERDERR